MSLRVVDTELLEQLTGPDSRNRTAARWGVYGTDLGHMFWHQDRLYMVFGDTFGAGGFGGANWRSSTMAWISDPDPRNGLAIEAMITGPDGTAKELIPSRKIPGVEKTVIPTSGISIDGRMYLHYMSVRSWGAPGRWDVRYSGLAYSDDNGQTWQTPPYATWAGGMGFEQVAMLIHGDYLYMFGIPEGRFGGVRLRRVVPNRILDRSAYVYWQGERWVDDPGMATVIVPPAVGELSVAWSEQFGRWLMMYLNPVRQAIVLRTAPELVGPWGEEQVVVTAENHPGLYSPYIVPRSNPGEDLYFTMSLWGRYNVVLMRAQLEPDTARLAAGAEPAAQQTPTLEPGDSTQPPTAPTEQTTG